MSDKQQSNKQEQQQRKNSIGQIQEQLDNQADAIASITASEDIADAVASVQKDEIE